MPCSCRRTSQADDDTTSSLLFVSFFVSIHLSLFYFLSLCAQLRNRRKCKQKLHFFSVLKKCYTVKAFNLVCSFGQTPFFFVGDRSVTLHRFESGSTEINAFFELIHVVSKMIKTNHLQQRTVFCVLLTSASISHFVIIAKSVSFSIFWSLVLWFMLFANFLHSFVIEQIDSNYSNFWLREKIMPKVIKKTLCRQLTCSRESSFFSVFMLVCVCLLFLTKKKSRG